LRLGPYIPGIKTECNIAHSASNHLTDRWETRAQGVTVIIRCMTSQTAVSTCSDSINKHGRCPLSKMFYNLDSLEWATIAKLSLSHLHKVLVLSWMHDLDLVVVYIYIKGAYLYIRKNTIQYNRTTLFLRVHINIYIGF
jgi:uncharacterized hydantoinase/oxoprolinase family protein